MENQTEMLYTHKVVGVENVPKLNSKSLENSCNDPQGKEIHIGDTFDLANLRFACDDGKYKIIGW
jgi:hypothetical protein